MKSLRRLPLRRYWHAAYLGCCVFSGNHCACCAAWAMHAHSDWSVTAYQCLGTSVCMRMGSAAAVICAAVAACASRFGTHPWWLSGGEWL
jgi:hypothetical protein